MEKKHLNWFPSFEWTFHEKRWANRLQVAMSCWRWSMDPKCAAHWAIWSAFWHTVQRNLEKNGGNQRLENTIQAKYSKTWDNDYDSIRVIFNHYYHMSKEYIWVYWVLQGVFCLKVWNIQCDIMRHSETQSNASNSKLVFETNKIRQQKQPPRVWVCTGWWYEYGLNWFKNFAADQMFIPHILYPNLKA